MKKSAANLSTAWNEVFFPVTASVLLCGTSLTWYASLHQTPRPQVSDSVHPESGTSGTVCDSVLLTPPLAISGALDDGSPVRAPLPAFWWPYSLTPSVGGPEQTHLKKDLFWTMVSVHYWLPSLLGAWKNIMVMSMCDREVRTFMTQSPSRSVTWRPDLHHTDLGRQSCVSHHSMPSRHWPWLQFCGQHSYCPLLWKSKDRWHPVSYIVPLTSGKLVSFLTPGGMDCFVGVPITPFHISSFSSGVSTSLFPNTLLIRQ